MSWPRFLHNNVLVRLFKASFVALRSVNFAPHSSNSIEKRCFFIPNIIHHKLFCFQMFVPLYILLLMQRHLTHNLETLTFTLHLLALVFLALRDLRLLQQLELLKIKIDSQYHALLFLILFMLIFRSLKMQYFCSNPYAFILQLFVQICISLLPLFFCLFQFHCVEE